MRRSGIGSAPSARRGALPYAYIVYACIIIDFGQMSDFWHLTLIFSEKYNIIKMYDYFYVIAMDRGRNSVCECTSLAGRVFVKNIVSASILSADFCNLGRDIKNAEDAGCEYIHFDVMDGMFVKNISYGLPVLKSVSGMTKSILDVHLMINDPIRYVKDFALNGADIITFHIEAEPDVLETIDIIHSCGKKAGLSVKPGTPAKELAPYLDKADMFLVMTVEPGFGGQGFISEMLDKIRELKAMMTEKGLEIPIEVDGGINESTAELVKNAGASVLVAGSYLFNAPDMRAAVKSLIR